jgi:hypothetical protein
LIIGHIGWHYVVDITANPLFLTIVKQGGKNGNNHRNTSHFHDSDDTHGHEQQRNMQA